MLNADTWAVPVKLPIVVVVVVVDSHKGIGSIPNPMNSQTGKIVDRDKTEK